MHSDPHKKKRECLYGLKMVILILVCGESKNIKFIPPIFHKIRILEKMPLK